MTPDELRKAIAKADQWELTVSGAPLRIWFELANREGNCGSLRSGIAFLFDADVDVIGEPGINFVSAARREGVLARLRPFNSPFPPPHPPLPPQRRYWPIRELETPDGGTVSLYECCDCGAIVADIGPGDTHSTHDQFHRRITSNAQR